MTQNADDARITGQNEKLHKTIVSGTFELLRCENLHLTDLCSVVLFRRQVRIVEGAVVSELQRLRLHYGCWMQYRDIGKIMRRLTKMHGTSACVGSALSPEWAIQPVPGPIAWSLLSVYRSFGRTLSASLKKKKKKKSEL
jgi:hypothetical protein